MHNSFFTHFSFLDTQIAPRPLNGRVGILKFRSGARTESPTSMFTASQERGPWISARHRECVGAVADHDPGGVAAAVITDKHPFCSRLLPSATLH